MNVLKQLGGKFEKFEMKDPRWPSFSALQIAADVTTHNFKMMHTMK